ncbi:MAG: YbjN domain-containing protein [Rhodospirillales bacterium]|nr:YbjN domain-containing protein [Alphaproteobacteria bacterium]MCB9981345.1 YbjN domain-containing protein [Rhodospirillales bacterium]
MTTQLEIHEDDIHPLDSVEDVLSANNWTFERMAEDELAVDIMGRSGSYKLLFIWQGEMHALQFCAQLDLQITSNNIKIAREALLELNESLWMGHFDLPAKNTRPAFRHTCLLRGSSPALITELIDDMVDIALAQCERHYPLFTLLASANNINDAALSLAMMETAGES